MFSNISGRIKYSKRRGQYRISAAPRTVRFTTFCGSTTNGELLNLGDDILRLYALEDFILPEAKTGAYPDKSVVIDLGTSEVSRMRAVDAAVPILGWRNGGVMHDAAESDAKRLYIAGNIFAAVIGQTTPECAMDEMMKPLNDAAVALQCIAAARIYAGAVSLVSFPNPRDALQSATRVLGQAPSLHIS